MCALVFVVLDAGVAGAHVTVSPSSLPAGHRRRHPHLPRPERVGHCGRDRTEDPVPPGAPHRPGEPRGRVGLAGQRRSRPTLPKPITTDDGTFTSTTSEIDWSGSTIPVGQFGEFNVLAQGIPTGTSQLVFKAIQTYSDGTVVSWIEVPNKAVPDPEHPAPIITLTSGGGAASSTATTAAVTATATATATSSTSSGTNAWEIAALILAGFAVVLSLLAIWLGRPRLGVARSAVTPLSI